MKFFLEKENGLQLMIVFTIANRYAVCRSGIPESSLTWETSSVAWNLLSSTGPSPLKSWLKWNGAPFSGVGMF